MLARQHDWSTSKEPFRCGVRVAIPDHVLWCGAMHSSNVYRVLLIEDDPDTARVMSRVLENRPYYVRWVETGQDARIAIDEQQPDLIILDLMLPDTDGLLLTGTLKAMT